ncbi:MAG: phosphoribosylformylglycinamidine synthase subunit PurS [Deltaproteobacteria bacterium]|nr:phosphoribosylformylglycinamidine synthase subunit PurS [Deltaproteobacteria bacterium]
MAVRIEVRFKEGVVDAAGEAVRTAVERDLGIDLASVRSVEVYTIDRELKASEVGRVAERLFTDPLTQEYVVGSFVDAQFDWAIEVGFLPGVTDNVGNTARNAVIDLLGVTFSDTEKVYVSRMFLLSGDVTEDDAAFVASHLSNPLIQRVGWKTRGDFLEDMGMGLALPRVILPPADRIDEVDLEVSDEELMVLSRRGVLEGTDEDGSELRRGPLALDLEQLHVIRDYFRGEGRNPTDVELESLAQTWSEHCKHTIFAAQLDEVDSLYKTCIKGATERVRQMKGKDDPCLSVFSDNAGVIRFNSKWSVCYKVETHNSPSALDPYGGAITGIVGVNRDPLGTGKGSHLVMNMYGFCFGDPDYDEPLPTRDPEGMTPILHPKVIFEGVRRGVEDGGNKSGIPTPLGFIVFDERYMGKPLVFVGTVGLMPAYIGGLRSYEKKARRGDLIVMAGGRVGKDGIHGATFSSEGLHAGSPMGAVQIGDPITQKKLGDAQLEARDRKLYSSVTDCGAGGISCSCGEMALESGGCEVNLDQVPVKYSGLAPYAVWISESQERMTYAVPPAKLDEFLELMRSRDVEATVVGRFTDSGRCVVKLAGRSAMDVDLTFLHEGLPRMHLSSSWTPPEGREPDFEVPADMGETFEQLMGRLNLCSREYVVRQYDHEVQGGSVIKPLTGVELDVHNDAAVIRPVLGSNEGLALACGILPWYGDIDTYGMAAACIDTAIRGVVAVGADPDEVALLDNFCWCSSDEPERLGQLKRAAQACYDYATAYGAPFISGKDSMFNDFKGYDADGEPLKISVPPTLLVSSIAKVHDVTSCIDVQAMKPGDSVYVIGVTRDELGGSEYLGMMTGRRASSPGPVGTLPAVNAQAFLEIYRGMHRAIRGGLIASAASCGRGGLGAALARTAMAGGLGIVGDLSQAGAFGVTRTDAVLFSESQGRFVVTVAPDRKDAFEIEMGAAVPLQLMGQISDGPNITLRGLEGGNVVDVAVARLKAAYKKTLDW